MTDVVVVGAGPAGLSAALGLLDAGLSVTVADDQPAPGGRIFTAIETRAIKGAEDREGASLVAQFRRSGGTYMPATQVWQVEPAPRVFLTHEGRASMLEPRFVLLATGAQERPMPFPGWHLPGVMTVGAAQILLKTARQIPDEPVWLAGSGPLLLLYARQLIAAGGTVAGILDTTPRGRLSVIARHVPGALRHGWRDLARGMAWLVGLRRVRVIRDICRLEALGVDRLSAIRYSKSDGTSGQFDTRLLLVHDGVVPGLHATMAAGLVHRWNAAQKSFQPVLNDYGASSNPAIFVTGDGATIGGAKVAMLSGRVAAIGIALAAGKLKPIEAKKALSALQKRLSAAAPLRRLLDEAYPPEVLSIPDATVLCRCEEVTAGRIREILKDEPHLDPDGVKIATRAGMGYCQGRLCGLSLTRLIVEAHGSSPDEVGFLKIRPPLKPLTIGELASIETDR